jgi:hypothetical protein
VKGKETMEEEDGDIRSKAETGRERGEARKEGKGKKQHLKRGLRKICRGKEELKIRATWGRGRKNGEKGMQVLCVTDRCVPDLNFLDVAPLV